MELSEERLNYLLDAERLFWAVYISTQMTEVNPTGKKWGSQFPVGYIDGCYDMDNWSAKTRLLVNSDDGGDPGLYIRVFEVENPGIMTQQARDLIDSNPLFIRWRDGRAYHQP